MSECTFNKTDATFKKQYWRHCYDCFKLPTEGACVVCLQLCHENHKLGELKNTRFFCDCGNYPKCKLKIEDDLEFEMARDFSMDWLLKKAGQGF